MTDREKMQANLAHARTVRGQMDQHIADLKLELTTWMDAVIRAISREKAHLNESNSVADGEMETPFILMIGKLQDYETAQQSAAHLDTSISGMVQDLADEEIWKAPACASCGAVVPLGPFDQTLCGPCYNSRRL